MSQDFVFPVLEIVQGTTYDFSLVFFKDEAMLIPQPLDGCEFVVSILDKRGGRVYLTLRTSDASLTFVSPNRVEAVLTPAKTSLFSWSIGMFGCTALFPDGSVRELLAGDVRVSKPLAVF